MYLEKIAQILNRMNEINTQTTELYRQQQLLKIDPEENARELIKVYDKLADLDTEYRYLIRKRHEVQVEQQKDF